MHDKHIIESMTDDDDTICPICCGPMDDTDLSFFPCPCKFQLCLWCFNEIREKDNRCPNCRKPYDQSLFTVHNSSNIENEDGANASSSRKGKKSCRHTICRRESNHGTSPMDDELLRLQKTRIVQRNLVYITGMVREDASESVLLGDDMFGKYGKIQKVVVNKSFLVVNSTVNFYVTFERDEDALACILAVNGFRYKGKLLRASFGTTKYCNSYIHGVPCDNPDCIYLHAEAPTEYCFLRDEMSDKDDKFFQCTHPGYGSLPYSRNTIKRMEIRYGDELPEKDEELCFFGVDSLWEDQFVGLGRGCDVDV